jgi:hypothetical protein
MKWHAMAFQIKFWFHTWPPYSRTATAVLALLHKLKVKSWEDYMYYQCYSNRLDAGYKRKYPKIKYGDVYCYAYCMPFTLQFNWMDWSNIDSIYSNLFIKLERKRHAISISVDITIFFFRILPFIFSIINCPLIWMQVFCYAYCMPFTL